MAIDYKPEQNDYKNMTPFKTWLTYQINTWGINNFPFLENDFDQLTNYGMLMKLMKAVNDNISNQNLVEDDMTKLYGAFTELQNYINNYFDNLDVQEEINNKLDAMAESGQLTDIIAQYLGLAGMITFNNVAEMKQAQNLVNGSKCATLGFYNVNDNGNSFYKIRTITNNDVVDEKTIIALYDNNLIAELIIQNQMSPEQFGAKGNDIDDDSSAINTLLLNVNNVILNNKTYKVNNTINLQTNNNIKGNKDSIIHKTGNNSVISANGKSNIILKDFSITGEFDTSENQNGISLYSCSDSIIDNIKISNVSNSGLYLNNGININVSNMDISNTKHLGFISYQGNNTNFRDSVINAQNCEFKYNCQFKSCINSTMDNITIINGTEISCFISQENIADNPESIRPIHNTINNIKCINHGKYWTISGTGVFNAIYVDGDYSTFTNLHVEHSYTGGFYSKANNSTFNNIIVDDYSKLSSTYVGVFFPSGNNNNISNINVKNGNGMIGYRSIQNYANINNISLEDCGSSDSSKPQGQLIDTYTNYNNVTVTANSIDARGIAFYSGSNNALNLTLNNFIPIKVNNSYNSYDISGSVPTTVNINAIYPTKNTIRGNFTKPFKYKHNIMTVYDIDSQNSLANLTWVAGDVRVFNSTGIAATGYEKTIYNGTSWVNINQLVNI